MIRGLTVTDAHIHIQPWEMLLPAVRDRMEAGRRDLTAIREMMESPAALLCPLSIGAHHAMGLAAIFSNAMRSRTGDCTECNG